MKRIIYVIKAKHISADARVRCLRMRPIRTFVCKCTLQFRSPHQNVFAARVRIFGRTYIIISENIQNLLHSSAHRYMNINNKFARKRFKRV